MCPVIAETDVPHKEKYEVGIVVFPGFEPLDVFGPVTAFGGARPFGKPVTDPPLFGITLLGETAQPVSSDWGPMVVPAASIHEPPALDILLIPGGLGTRKEIENTKLIAGIASAAKKVTWMTSVCTGAALLCRTGLLDKRRATTNHIAFEWVRSLRPEVEWIDGPRWIVDDRYVTSAGVSAGTDMALFLIMKHFGRAVADYTALTMEYDWKVAG